MKVFVTGSTGLLGSNLVQALLAQGYEVKALARSREKAEKVLGRHPNLDIILGDMENIDGFAADLNGTDVLFHAAAYFREYYGPGDHWTPLKRINVDATIDLLTEAEARGVRQTIYVSSTSVIGESQTSGPSDETTPPDTDLDINLYMKSKVVAEQAIAEWLKTHRMPVVLILPSAMLGPGDSGPTTLGGAIIDVIQGKFPVLVPGGLEMVDVRDVAQAMIQAVRCGKSGERYIVSQGYHNMTEMAQTIGKITGTPAPRFQIPYPVFLTMAWVQETIAGLRGTVPQLNVSAVRLLNRPRILTSVKAQRELEITLRPLEASLRDEVAWFREQGMV